jgi:cytidylate kinase
MAHLLREIEARDERDRLRTVAPLVPAADAIIIDTSSLNVQEVVEQVLAEVKRKFALGK